MEFVPSRFRGGIEGGADPRVFSGIRTRFNVVFLRSIDQRHDLISAFMMGGNVAAIEQEVRFLSVDSVEHVSIRIGTDILRVPEAGRGATPGESSASWVNCLPLRGRLSTCVVLTAISKDPDCVSRMGPSVVTSTLVFAAPIRRFRSTSAARPTVSSIPLRTMVSNPGAPAVTSKFPGRGESRHNCPKHLS